MRDRSYEPRMKRTVAIHKSIGVSNRTLCHGRNKLHLEFNSCAINHASLKIVLCVSITCMCIGRVFICLVRSMRITRVSRRADGSEVGEFEEVRMERRQGPSLKELVLARLRVSSRVYRIVTVYSYYAVYVKI